MNLKKLTFLIFAMPLLHLGCTHLFLQPHRERYAFVEMDKLPFTELTIPSTKSVSLTSWYFHTQKICALPNFKSLCTTTGPRALVVHFHGNAENISSHYRAVAWLTIRGFDVLTFDYRGYGGSSGRASVSGALDDSLAALIWATAKAKELHIPVIVYGQSLGGSLALRVLADHGVDQQVAAILIEGSFSSYRKIAREKLADTWLTWPFQWLAYVLIDDSWSPMKGDLRRLSSTPLLLVYSEHDPVVPITHGETLFQNLGDPKDFWRIPEPGHIHAAFVNNGFYRPKLISFLNEAIKASKR